MPMTNSELLAASPSQLMTAIEKQRRFVLLHESQPRSCPNCGNPMTAWEGRGIANVDDYDLSDSHGDEGQCTNCQRAIRYTLPIIGGWYWSLVPIPDGKGGMN